MAKLHLEGCTGKPTAGGGRNLNIPFDTGLRCPRLEAGVTQSLLGMSGLGLLLLAGCGDKQPTMIDGSSPEAFEQTISQARREIPDADRLVFDRAIRTVGGRRYAERDPQVLARVTFDGMTAEQVVADQKARED